MLSESLSHNATGAKFKLFLLFMKLFETPVELLCIQNPNYFILFFI